MERTPSFESAMPPPSVVDPQITPVRASTRRPLYPEAKLTALSFPSVCSASDAYPVSGHHDDVAFSHRV